MYRLSYSYLVLAVIVMWAPVRLSATPVIAKPISSLSDQARTGLLERYHAGQDHFSGGFTTGPKAPTKAVVDYTLRGVFEGNTKEREFLQLTLHSYMRLEDKIGGGFFELSKDTEWSTPRYVKRLDTQAEAIYVLARAYSWSRDPEYLRAAKGGAKFVLDTLGSPDGGWFSTTLEDKSHGVDYFKMPLDARSKSKPLGVDKTISTRSAALFTSSLLTLYSVSPEQQYLEVAARTLSWIETARRADHGAYSCGDNGSALECTLSVGRAYLAQYEATGDRSSLGKAGGVAVSISESFSSQEDRKGVRSVPLPKASDKPDLMSNVEVARFALLLSHYTGDSAHHRLAEASFSYIFGVQEISELRTVLAVLLADAEAASEPVHFTVVGAKEAPSAKALYLEALQYFVPLKRVDWWDKSEGPMLNPDVQYPELDEPALFICTSKRCSLPIFDPKTAAVAISAVVGGAGAQSGGK